MANVRSGEQLKRYRESYNYRYEYFKRNPGLFGCVWFCSQCYRPLFGKKQVVIDHIVPLAKGGKNHVSNCTAICQKCNRAKSDKIDGRVVKGKVFKLFESSVFGTQRGVGAVAALGVGLTAGAVSTTARAGKGVLSGGFHVAGVLVKKTLSVVTYPLRKGKFISRMFFLALYVLGILYFLSTNTTLLDAWLK